MNYQPERPKDNPELSMYGKQIDHMRKYRDKFVDEWKNKNEAWCEDAKANGYWATLEKELRRRADFMSQTEYRRNHGSGQSVKPIYIDEKELHQIKEAFSGFNVDEIDDSAVKTTPEQP